MHHCQRLDYCNSLLYGVADGLMRRLQSVQNAAERLVTGARCCDPPTTPLVARAAESVVYDCCPGSPMPNRPGIIVLGRQLSNCQLVSDTHLHRLRSSDSLACAVLCTRNTYGDWCFAAARPQVWISLPAELWQCDSRKQLRWCLTTHFSGYGTTALCDFCWLAPYRNTLTYFLTNTIDLYNDYHKTVVCDRTLCKHQDPVA